MRSVTTFSTQSRSHNIRDAHAGLRLRERRGLRLQRRPVRVFGDLARRHDMRESVTSRARVAAQRQRPEPPLRGFLPLFRH